MGGKGNNVARALKCLGRDVRPATFLGGPVGRLCEERLRRDDGLDPLAIATEAPTRVILTVRTGETNAQTAFFDPDPAITDAEADALYRSVEAALRRAGRDAHPVGFEPAPATHHLYSDLIALARSCRVPVLLDTYGPALEAVWGFWPEALKLNRREAAVALGLPDRPGDAQVFELLHDWARHGVQIGLVTDGAGAVLVQARGERYRVLPPAVVPVNPIGAGDSLLAGLADGLLSGLEIEPMLRRALACAVASTLVWDAGAIDRDEVQRLEADINIEPLGRAPADAEPAMLVRKTVGRKR